MIRSLTILCGAFALLLALGCGQKGPLYLPPTQPQAAGDGKSQGDTDPQQQAETDTEKPE